MFTSARSRHCLQKCVKVKDNFKLKKIYYAVPAWYNQQKRENICCAIALRSVPSVRRVYYPQTSVVLKLFSRPVQRPPRYYSCATGHKIPTTQYLNTDKLKARLSSTRLLIFYCPTMFYVFTLGIEGFVR